MDKDNAMHVKCNAFAVKDHVSFEGDDPEARVPVSDMPLHTFLPTQADSNKLKERMIIIVQRFLREQAGLDTNAPNHITHKYSDQSSSKSEYMSFDSGLMVSLPGAQLHVAGANESPKDMDSLHFLDETYSRKHKS